MSEELTPSRWRGKLLAAQLVATVVTGVLIAALYGGWSGFNTTFDPGCTAT